MNNQVAAPCCGSCKHYEYIESMLDVCCNELEADRFNLAMPEGLCLTGFYTPRNPIPIIELPGVRELVEAAYREGLHYGFEEEGDYPAPLKVDRMVSKFMKALEAK